MRGGGHVCVRTKHFLASPIPLRNTVAHHRWETFHYDKNKPLPPKTLKKAALCLVVPSAFSSSSSPSKYQHWVKSSMFGLSPPVLRSFSRLHPLRLLNSLQRFPNTAACAPERNDDARRDTRRTRRGARSEDATNAPHLCRQHNNRATTLNKAPPRSRQKNALPNGRGKTRRARKVQPASR